MIKNAYKIKVTEKVSGKCKQILKFGGQVMLLMNWLLFI
jgi:hypothetical protein